MAFFPSRKTFSLWVIVLLGSCLAAPQLFAEAQPGTMLLLQLDRDDVKARRLASLADELAATLSDAGIGYTELYANDSVVGLRVAAADIEAARALLEPVLAAQAGSLVLDEPEPGLLHLTLTADGMADGIERAAERSVEVIGRRVRELDVQAPIVERQGVDRIVVKAPGLKDATRLKDILGRAGRLTLQFVDASMPAEQAVAGEAPAGSEVIYSVDRQPFLLERRVVVSGQNIVDAQAAMDKYIQQPVFTFVFDAEGKARFGKATAENVGRQIAIVLDETVMSAPVIREPILGGTGQISGDFTTESAQDLALMLRAGALPAALTIIEERVNEPLEAQGAKN
jgi:SecD/SecF fusion protein